jgi:hypothetical protein
VAAAPRGAADAVSNLGSLPQIPIGTTITIVSNTDWLDQFYVQQPGFPAAPISVGATLIVGSTAVTVSSTSGIVPGSLVVGYGILPGVSVVAITSSTSIVVSIAVLASATNVNLFVYGPPLDLTGISFKSVVRPTIQSTTVLLVASTLNNLMINNTILGSFGWNVPAAKLPTWPIGLTTVGQLGAVVDIQASDASGELINLCALSGALPLNVVLPETR